MNWRRITRPVQDILRAKLDACDFEAWKEDYSAPATDGPGWGLELFSGGKPVKQIIGSSSMPEQWPVFQSLLDLCAALAENRNRENRRILETEKQAI